MFPIFLVLSPARPYIQGVPILSVNISRGDRGPIGEYCLLWAFFDFNDLKFSRKNYYFFRQQLENINKECTPTVRSRFQEN